MKKTTWLAGYDFRPEEHESELRAVIAEIDRLPHISPRSLDRILARHPKSGRGFFSKSELIRGYRHLAERYGWPQDPRLFEEKLRMKPIRTLSGVAPVTVLTKPFPCPGECIFCPSDVRMPKSYLSREPGAQRAAYHDFDPYAQTFSRLRALHLMGHPVDKVELIILGGTWSSYPESYQKGFIRGCLEAMNAFEPGTTAQRTSPAGRHVGFSSIAEEVDGSSMEETYNEILTRFLRQRLGGLTDNEESATWQDVESAQRRNESARFRCVGLSVETRPDHVTEEEVARLRRLGATKVQIGFQSLSDRVLTLNKRGHDVAAIRSAVRLLRQGGFKIQAHWMANLYGSSPEEDVRDFGKLFDDPDFRPDELKIYPCSLVDSAELMGYYRDRKWRPYTESELLTVVSACMMQVPPYCRLTRVIRDIPGDDIVAGNKTTNLRDVAEARLASEGRVTRDIRGREIRGRDGGSDRLRLEEIRYRTSTGEEAFLQFIDEGDRLVAFLRLALPDRPSFLEEISESALIREVHVYGAAVSIGERDQRKSQHGGLGSRLVRRAEELAREAGFADLGVISSVGTREYYWRLGFEDGPLYQHLPL